MFQKVALLFYNFYIRRSNIGRIKMDYMELMRGYAITGVRDWREAPASTKQNAVECLAPMYLADREQHIDDVLRQKKSSLSPKFIPMPRPSFGKSAKKKRFQWTFFSPVGLDDRSKDIISFELLILYKQKQCLAFRLEPGHPESKAHNYTHLQFNQELYKKRIQVEGIPSFISDSFPAFPLPGSDTISLFFAMIVAVHGYEGARKIMLRIFHQENDINKYGKYSRALDALLDLDRNGS